MYDRRPFAGGGLVCHSDRRSQYVGIRYTERLAEAGIEPSVGSVGDSYDNALTESIIGLFKTEVIHRRGPWRSLEAFEFATLEGVDCFNTRRLLEPIVNIPPAEAEARYYAQTEAQALAASSKPNRLWKIRRGSMPHAVPLLDQLLGVLKWVVGDRGYTSHAFLEHIWNMGARPAIPPQRHNAPVACPDWVYNNRKKVERLWARLK